jgi:hypothetical protein
MNRERQELERRQRDIQQRDEIEEVENMQFEDGEDDNTLARAKVDPQEVSYLHLIDLQYEIIRSSLQLLEDIQLTAESLEDMKSEVATDIYQTCLMMRRRVARIVQAKSFSNIDIESVAELLQIIDYIDTKLESYKKRYLKLKNKTLKELEKKKKRIDQEEAKN